MSEHVLGRYGDAVKGRRNKDGILDKGSCRTMVIVAGVEPFLKCLISVIRS